MKTTMAILFLAVVAVAAIVVNGATIDPSLAPAKLLLAYQNPADPSLDSVSIDASYEVQRDLILLAFCVGVCVLGAIGAGLAQRFGRRGDAE